MSYRSASDISGPASPSGISSRRLTNRNTNRYSVNQLYSMAAEQDPDVEDDLSRGKSTANQIFSGQMLTVSIPIFQLRSVYVN